MRVIAAMLLSGIISFGAGLISGGDEAKPQEVAKPKVETVTVSVPAMPSACERALLGGSEVVTLSLNSTTTLIDLVGNDSPQQGVEILDEYQKQYEKMHEHLVPYLADLKVCKQRIT